MILSHLARISNADCLEGLPDLTISKSELIAFWLVDGAVELARRMEEILMQEARLAADNEDRHGYHEMASEAGKVLNLRQQLLEAGKHITAAQVAAVRGVLDAWVRLGPRLALIEEEYRG